MFVRETNECEQLYSLDVLGVEDRSEKDQMEVLTDFRESVTRQEDGRYEKLSKDRSLKVEYEKIVKDQLANGIVEKAPEKPAGKRTYYMPHKPVIRENATTTTTTKIRMVFDVSAKPAPLANSINECMFTGPSLQPLLWDILIRARMTPNLLLADIQKAFLQIGVKETDRDAFRFLFEIDGKEEHFRFARLPFGVEASPFLLGATLGYHLEQQPTRFEETVTALKENTYVDNIMKTGSDTDDLRKFKEESSIILEDAKFPIHKWESNIACLEDENMPNPSKILGHVWDKQEDTLEFEAATMPENQPVTKRSILSRLGRVYDPLGMVSPTMAEGKHIFRDACEERKGWNAEVSESLKRKWIKWNNQMKNVKVPRAITKKSDVIEGIQLHLFTDASNLACCAATVAVVEHKPGTVKDEEDELTKMQRRLRKAKDDAWKRWKREYVHSLLESQRVNNKVVEAPQIGDVVLVVGEEKNRGEWKKGKVLRQVRGKDETLRVC
ncbi:Hypothetical predicted protein [Paramuricea clavata]|uniref:Uncharacterized protein n=1 Tax=Paramuricea clavata TaxID=317549 RepID=A0A7D9D748_PARCT|nr:Hypothetical predicted protein [Paramuricea clavata]